MSRKKLLGIAVTLLVTSTAGCCSWCEKHCPRTATAALPPYAYQPAVCCTPVAACCPAPTTCAPGPTSYAPNWTGPAQRSNYPQTCCQP